MDERSVCEIVMDDKGVWRTLPIYCGYDWELVANLFDDIINQYFKDVKDSIKVEQSSTMYVQVEGNQISINTKNMPERYARVVWDGKKLTPQFSNDLKT